MFDRSQSMENMKPITIYLERVEETCVENPFVEIGSTLKLDAVEFFCPGSTGLLCGALKRAAVRDFVV